jgi:hypothetical protein
VSHHHLNDFGPPVGALARDALTLIEAERLPDRECGHLAAGTAIRQVVIGLDAELRRCHRCAHDALRGLSRRHPLRPRCDGCSWRPDAHDEGVLVPYLRDRDWLWFVARLCLRCVGDDVVAGAAYADEIEDEDPLGIGGSS